MLPLLLPLTGCSTYTHREYQPLVRALDGKNELEISTFPAGFPKTTKSGFFLEKRVSHGAVEFQVFVRDAVAKIGKNPHVESIVIHSFSYQLPGEPKVDLLKDYGDNFWMQGNPRYDKERQAPIAYHQDGLVTVAISMTLNGTDYVFSGDMAAREYTRFGLQFLQFLERR